MTPLALWWQGFVAWAPLAVLLTAGLILLETRKPAPEDPGPASPARPILGWEWAVLAVLLLAAAGLRLPTISLPFDHLEYTLISEVEMSQTLTEVVLNHTGMEQAHQPLARAGLAALKALHLPYELLRQVHLLFALLTLIAAFLLVRELFPDRPWIALGATAWLAVSPLHIRYSADVTPYMPFLLVSTLSFLALLRALRTGGRGAWLSFVVLSSVGFYLHLFMATLIIAQAAVAGSWLLFDPPGLRRKRLALGAGQAFLAAGLALVPWIPCVRRTAELFPRYVGREVPLYALHFPYAQQLAELTRILAGLPKGWPLTWAVPPLLAIAGAAVLWRARRRKEALFLALPLCAIPFLKAAHSLRYATASAGGTYFAARHFLPFEPLFVALVLAAGLSLGRRARACFCLLPVVLAAAGLRVDRSAFEKPAAPAAARWIHERERDGDAIAILPAKFFSPLFVYYLTDRRIPFADTAGWRLYPGERGSWNGPRVCFPVDDRDVPYPEVLSNLFFERVFLVEFLEEEFGLPEMAAGPSEDSIRYVKEHGAILEEASFPQCRVILASLRHDPPVPWAAGGSLELDLSDEGWRRFHRYLAWNLPEEGLAPWLGLRLPSPAPAEPLSLGLRYGPDEAGGHARTKVRVTLDGEIVGELDLGREALNVSFELGPTAARGNVLTFGIAPVPGSSTRFPVWAALRAGPLGPPQPSPATSKSIAPP